MRIRRTLLAAATLVAFTASFAQAQTAPLTPDVPQTAFAPSTAGYDYVKREVMIPMRDGVKLHTVIVIPKGASHAPIAHSLANANNKVVVVKKHRHHRAHRHVVVKKKVVVAPHHRHVVKKKVVMAPGHRTVIVKKKI